MEKKDLSINSENILPIIKKWLYSEKDIFLRELVSNATDAINKLKIIDSKLEKKFRIDISIDKKAKTLTISDNGIGMTSKEIEKYISQIAFSGASEFLEKYKSKDEKDQIIGHFGLGFYSAYMVSKKVTIDTLSYQDNEKASFWSCDGSSTYFIDTGKRKNRGTTVTLYIDDENEEYLDENRVKNILTKFCPYLPFAIHVNDKHINNKSPLWQEKAQDLKDKDYLTFFKELYPFEEDPIFWIHIDVDYPFHLKGILYFPKIKRDFDFNKNSVKLFCNRVFVSDNCRDILPEYLMVLKGAIDSPDIPLNVSRSYLQTDRTIKQLGSHISKKICDKLKKLFINDREKFIKSWENIETIIKLGILQDEKFYERSKDFLIFKEVNTDSWITIEEYLSRNKDKVENKIFYTSDNNSHFLKIYKEKQIDVLFFNQYLDTAVINFLENKLKNEKFQRIDGAIDDSIIDKSKEDTVLDSDGKTKGTKLADFIKSCLDTKDLDVEAQSLASQNIPAFIMIKEEERRFRDYMTLTNQDNFSTQMPLKKTFVVNTNNKLVKNTEKLHKKNPKLAKDLIKHIYDLATLSQKEMKDSQIENFVNRSNEILESLSTLTSE